MLMLFLLGPQLEQILGRARFLALYFVSLLGGSAAVMAFSEPYLSTLGASGAIYGLMGGLLLLAWRHKGDVRGILIWIGLNVALSFTWAGISWQGHLGGLVGGLGVALILVFLPKQQRRTSPVAAHRSACRCLHRPHRVAGDGARLTRNPRRVGLLLRDSQ